MKSLIILSSITIICLGMGCNKSSSSQKNEDSITYARSMANTWATQSKVDTTKTYVDANGTKFVKDVVFLNNVEAAKLQNKIANISASDQEEFGIKLRKVIEKLQSPEVINSSLSETIKSTQEFKDFYNFCSNNGKTGLALYMGELFNDANLLSGVVLVAFDLYRIKYNDLMQQVQSEIRVNQYNTDGLYIMRSDLSIERRLAKKILATM